MFLFIAHLQTDPMFNNNNNNNNKKKKNNYSEIHDEDSLQISILTNLNVFSFSLKFVYFFIKQRKSISLAYIRH